MRATHFWHLRTPLAALALLAAGFLPASASDAMSTRASTGSLSRMTLEEKVGQLNLISHGPPLRWEDIQEGRSGALLNFNNAQDVARAQALARKSRLQIPPFSVSTSFTAFARSSRFRLEKLRPSIPRLSRLASEWAAREASYVGVNWTFAPMADLSRDSRWGRIVEGFGEDPYLGSVLTAARVEGFRAGGLATATKHFAGYGAPQGGRDYDTTYIPPAEMYDTYLPPFRAALEAGSVSFMAAFNALNGMPSAANPWLLTDVLRGQWGFDGFVTSDWASIHELLGHGIAADGAEAARKALARRRRHGHDGSALYPAHSVRSPSRSGARSRCRRSRAACPADQGSDGAVRQARHRREPRRRDLPHGRIAAARPAEVARETLVLLQNRGNVLPIAPHTRSIAVIGPLADAPRDQIRPPRRTRACRRQRVGAQGIRDRAQIAGMEVRYAAGCDLMCRKTDQFPPALEAAQGADLVVAVFGEPQELSGEAASRARLTLNGNQAEILKALAATGKPVALVIIGGRPLELGDLAEKLPAIVMAWYPGTEAGPAIADVLFGDENPSGKLPLSWPRTIGQLPLYYNRLPTGRPTLPDNRFTVNYVDEDISPLYPFGWGLSYSQFAYSDAAIGKKELSTDDTLEASVTITNTGSRTGQEVAQLYIRDPVASRSRPLRQLKAFDKIALKPGEAKRVTLRVPVKELGFHLDDGTYVIEEGAIQVFVGGNSKADAIGDARITKTIRIPMIESRAGLSRAAQ